ncbi:GerMN domain-containing protein [Effusibacillus pohliae]|uniref:GerMN domain-containing protein n=1 Tax=Effusibacillus pohliae TaxID=232270 RepID=UPI0003737780|nr:GerMN domain-containing protein [Effusibacillus pohliae]
MRHQKKMLVGVLIVSLAGTAGCGLLSKTSGPIDQPPPGANQAADKKETTSVNLYFADEKGFVVPLRVNIPKTQAPATEMISYLTEEKAKDLLKDTGLHAVIPPGTKMSVNIKDNTAIVDFSREVLNLKVPKAEQQLVDAVVWTLTELPNIKQVQIKVNGNVVPALPASGTPIGQPLSRANGINLQVAPNINPAETTKLTLYYQASNQAGTFSYLVPVTRLIKKTDEDKVKATIAELAAGPMTPALKPTLPASAKLLSKTVSGDTVMLDFDNLLTEGAATEQTKLFHSIVLSVLENTPNAQKVKITVNGQTPAAAPGMNLSQPMARPQVINQKQL